MNNTYDYIIVGGGSAGCVLANRLSADPKNQVLLLEAGNDDTSPLVHLPAGAVTMVPTRFNNWALTTKANPNLNNRTGYQPRGKVLGGSSSINAMIYIRGHQDDYNDWAHLGWSWEEVLPYFLKSEKNHALIELGEEKSQLDLQLHGIKGPLSVSNSYSNHNIADDFVNAAIDCGHPHNCDFNGKNQEGVGRYQLTQVKGRRCSSAAAYLTPVRHRANLTVMTHAKVTSLIIEDQQCKGLKLKQKNQAKELTFFCNKEVALCAGAIHSPQILMLSGVGDPTHLTKHNIEAKVQLNGVGQNLQDHPDYVSCYKVNDASLYGLSPSGIWHMSKQLIKYLTTRKGMLSSNFAETGGFLKTAPELSRPDIQFHFVIAAVKDHARDWRTALLHGFSNHICVLRPYSKGSITLNSNDPFDSPIIDTNFMADKRDRQTLLKGIKLSNQIINNEHLQKYEPAPLNDDLTFDEDVLFEKIKAHTDTVYHPVGTCKMGLEEEPDAVVSPTLKVIGVKGLRVVDASIFPNLIGGNTNAPTIMVAERAADFMLAENS